MNRLKILHKDGGEQAFISSAILLCNDETKHYSSIYLELAYYNRDEDGQVLIDRLGSDSWASNTILKLEIDKDFDIIQTSPQMIIQLK